MIPQYEPSYPFTVSTALARYVADGGWCTEGPKTREFERSIAEYTGAKHCVVTTSGTMALTLAGIALGIGPGDEVIIPAYSMIATANAFRVLGASVRFADVEWETLCLDEHRVALTFTERTKAIVMVSANGRTPLHAWGAWGPLIIEDACQSLGSRTADGTHVGRAGHCGAFSFSPHKIVSTGQGGACVTDNDDLADKLRRAKDFGRDSGGGDVHPHFGINGKFTDLQAVVGLEQMAELPRRVERKRRMRQLYARHFLSVPEARMYGWTEHSTPWFIDILCDRRDELADHLREHGIGTRKMYPPIPHQESYRAGGSYPVAENVGRCGLWLPSSLTLTDEEIARVCETIREFYR